MIQKLKQKNGETLIETLISLLIAVLCMGLLSTSVLTATNINKKTRELDEKYSADLQNAEGRVDKSSNRLTGVVVIEFRNSPSGEYEKEEQVTLFGGSKETSAFVAYTKEGS